MIAIRGQALQNLGMQQAREESHVRPCRETRRRFAQEEFKAALFGACSGPRGLENATEAVAGTASKLLPSA
jgi:hypothetical protein